MKRIALLFRMLLFSVLILGNPLLTEASTATSSGRPDPGRVPDGQNQAASFGITGISSIGNSLPVTGGSSGPEFASPDVPVNVSPASGAVDVSINPTLSVMVSDATSNNLTVRFYGRKKEVTPPFSMVVIPDAQNYTSYLFGGTPSMFTAQTTWCVNNQAAYNIKYVGFVGDLVNFSISGEWANANNSVSKLDATLPGVPYGIAPGNHDLLWGTGQFNQYFPVSRFMGRSYYGGHYGTGNENHYDFFSSGNLEFIVICLSGGDQVPGSAVLDWADALLKSNLNKRGIIINHSLMWPKIQSAFTTPGQAIYDALKDNPNLFLMVCGHEYGSGYRQDTYNGHTIFTMISDYQDEPNGGNGWLRIAEFDPADNTIHMKTWSPTLNAWKTGVEDQFDLPYDMQTGQFQLLGTNTGQASGSVSSVSWPGLSPQSGYEWYATVDNGTSTATSSTWSFTTGTAQAPAVFNMTGGGSFCKGGSGLPVGLSGSQSGVSYTLFKDGTAQSIQVAGTGSAITFGNHTAGVYTAQGTNTIGTTTMSGSTSITENPIDATVSLNVVNASCSGGQGTVTFTFDKGTGPYTLNIGTTPYNNITKTLTVVEPAGSYNYTAADATGCSKMNGSFNITAPAAISITGVVTPESAGSKNGAIDITVTGGTLPMSYSWTGTGFTSSSQDISGLSAGDYTVTVTDYNGCIQSKMFTVGTAAQLSASITTTNNGTSYRTCPVYFAGDPVIFITGKSGNFGLSSSVTLDVKASGGSGSYTYSWSPKTGLSSTTRSLITAKPSATTTYTVTVKDSKGGSTTRQVIVTVRNITCTSSRKAGVLMCIGNSAPDCVLLTNTTVINNTTYKFSYSGVVCTGCYGASLMSGEPEVQAEPLIKAWPNPTGGNLSLELTGFMQGRGTLNIFRNDGTSVLRENIELSGDTQVVTLDLSDQPAGIYLVQLVHNLGVLQTTIVRK